MHVHLAVLRTVALTAAFAAGVLCASLRHRRTSQLHIYAAGVRAGRDQR